MYYNLVFLSYMVFHYSLNGDPDDDGYVDRCLALRNSRVFFSGPIVATPITSGENRIFSLEFSAYIKRVNSTNVYSTMRCIASFRVQSAGEHAFFPISGSGLVFTPISLEHTPLMPCASWFKISRYQMKVLPPPLLPPPVIRIYTPRYVSYIDL